MGEKDELEWLDLGPAKPPSAPLNTFANTMELMRSLGKPRVCPVRLHGSDGEVETIFVNDQNAMHEILNDDSGLWVKGPSTFEPFRSIVEKHLIAIEGDLHKKLRRAAQEALGEQIHSRAVSIAMKHASRLAEKLQVLKVVDNLDKLVRATSLDIISEMLFSEPWNALDDCSESNEKAFALSQLMVVLHFRVVDLTIREWRKQPSATGDAEPFANTLHSFIEQEIGKGDREGKKDMLSVWLADPSLSMDEVKNLCLTFLTMGHENVGTAIAWTLLKLAENPDAQEEIRTEIDSLGIFSKPSLEWNDLMRLKTIENAFMESIRLMPSVAALTRMPRRDTVVSGMKIPSGSECIFNIFGSHRETEIWGVEADKFDMHRRNHGWDPDSFYSFGAGQRRCVGMPLSSIESKAVVGMILWRGKITSSGNVPVEGINFVSLRPGPHQFIFQSRL